MVWDYKYWKEQLVLHFSEKNKVGFVEGTSKRSTSNVVSAKDRDMVKNVVMGWILSIIEDKISNTKMVAKRKRRFGTSLMKGMDKPPALNSSLSTKESVKLLNQQMKL